MGPIVRGHHYGYHNNFFGDNIRYSSVLAYFSSSVDRKIIERLENTFSKLTEELAEQREGFSEQRKAEEDREGNNITNQATAAAVQLFHLDYGGYFFMSW